MHAKAGRAFVMIIRIHCRLIETLCVCVNASGQWTIMAIDHWTTIIRHDVELYHVPMGMSLAHWPLCTRNCSTTLRIIIGTNSVSVGTPIEMHTHSAMITGYLST